MTYNGWTRRWQDGLELWKKLRLPLITAEAKRARADLSKQAGKWRHRIPGWNFSERNSLESYIDRRTQALREAEMAAGNTQTVGLNPTTAQNTQTPEPSPANNQNNPSEKTLNLANNPNSSLPATWNSVPPLESQLQTLKKHNLLLPSPTPQQDSPSAPQQDTSPALLHHVGGAFNNIQARIEAQARARKSQQPQQPKPHFPPNLPEVCVKCRGLIFKPGPSNYGITNPPIKLPGPGVQKFPAFKCNWKSD
ncbi:hypothetical protein QBC38DRAFT_439751 [Podospora fimiseda]|uniref:Uncharacterized protein n=1 Tax=Podospora fimiseda TaxID=252190 RepID=A0AAN7BYC0_9PEZI|nr:hypothetical protein QBC38DRAFT_439751 [Podospora fimiseda]